MKLGFVARTLDYVRGSGLPISEAGVLWTEIEGKVLAQINRPHALNSLTNIMCFQMRKYLINAQKNISMILVKGDSRVFSSGGDLKAIVKALNDPDDDASRIFYEEYEVDYMINKLKIPYISLIHGMVMGGGAGLSVLGKYRVATERTVYSMPETAIGLFPDAGASHYLSRLNNNLGMYLALTGDQLRGSDTLHCGLATHFCDSQKLESLEKELLSLKKVSTESIDTILDKYTKESASKVKGLTLQPHLTVIERIFGAETVEDIFNLLEKEGSDWSRKQLEKLKRLCPLSLKVTLKEIKLGKNLPLNKCLEMEYGIMRRMCYGTNFKEGVRATLIDKDNNPKWDPASIHDVTNDMVDEYFEPLPAHLRLTLAETD